jgi:hypothetical protein
MANRGLMLRIPIWVRVPGIIALVLAGVLGSTMLLGAGGDGSGHGSGGQGGEHDPGGGMEMRDPNGGQGGAHDSGRGMEMREPSGGQGGAGHDSGVRPQDEEHHGEQTGSAPSEWTPRGGGQRRRASADQGAGSSYRRAAAASTRTGRPCRRPSARTHQVSASSPVLTAHASATTGAVSVQPRKHGGGRA